MRRLLILTAALELGAGLALLAVPSPTATLLLGVPLESPVGVTVARVAGAALLALASACWQARGDTHSRAARGLVSAMLLYNIGAAAVLAHAGIAWGLHGWLLWPGVALHAGLALWCVQCWVRQPERDEELRL